MFCFISCASFCCGAFLALLFAYHMFPGSEGDPPKASNLTIFPLLYRGMIFIPISKTDALHVHHWLIYLIIGIFCTVTATKLEEDDFKNRGFHSIETLALLVASGFSMIMTLHGVVMYSDCFVFKTRNPYAYHLDD